MLRFVFQQDFWRSVIWARNMAMRRPFDPAAHELDPNFRLTKFADLKGWGCKVPQEVLLKLLEGLQPDSSAQDVEQSQFQYVAAVPRLGKLFIIDWRNNKTASRF